MPLSTFHPLVSRWFSERLGEPTRAQALGWAAIRERRHTLIAAPTGSGKTLAAFLTALDDLTQEAIAGPLPDEVRVVYVSPLKALSADIHKNLAEPRAGIERIAESMGLTPPRITSAVRTGDTPASARAAMLKTPPHILVTTPESLYLLLTAGRSRDMLRTVRTARSMSRLRPAVSSKYSDSGVVTRMWGGVFSIAARADAGVSPVLTAEVMRGGVRPMDSAIRSMPARGSARFLWMSALNALSGET